MRALVTGITGFVGGHLADHLLWCNDSVVGCSRSGKWPADLKYLQDRAEVIACDLADFPAVAGLFERHRFDTVYHLAGLANPRACRADPQLARRANVDGTENLYNAIVQSRQYPEILHVSTAYVYGHPAEGELPVRESAAIRASDPYASTKWEAEQAGVRYAAEYGLAIRRVRTFNHVGPRQPAGYIVSDWARQVARIEAGQAPAVVRVGNIDSRRDYSDVRDIVRAYRLLTLHRDQAGRCDVFNLGSGTSRSGREILELLGTLSGVPWRYEVDTNLLRPGEAPEIVADATPLRQLTAWQPEIDFHATLRDTLDHWRSQQ